MIDIINYKIQNLIWLVLLKCESCVAAWESEISECEETFGSQLPAEISKVFSKWACQACG